jgi:ATP-dependent protease Clp ATPase subunit
MLTKLFELIASNAKKSSTGARELNSLVSHIFEKIMYDTLCNAQKGNYTKCVLDDEIVSDNSKYHWE